MRILSRIIFVAMLAMAVIIIPLGAATIIMSGVQNTHPGFTGKVKSQIMHWNAMLQDFLMIRFGQIISRLTENTDPMFWIRRS